MQYFSDIDIACGPVGNNLLTMFAMQRGSRMVTYFPPQGAHIMAYYQSFCSALGVELYAICGSGEYWDDPKRSLNSLRWEVDVDSVARVLGDLL